MTALDSAPSPDLVVHGDTRLTLLDLTSLHWGQDLRRNLSSAAEVATSFRRRTISLPLLIVILLMAVPSAFSTAPRLSLPLSNPLSLQSSNTSSTGSYWQVGAYSVDSSALPNQGVRGTIDVVSQQVQGPLFFWVSDALSNNMWGQVGYYLFNGVTPVAFYSVWNLTSHTAVASGTTSLSAGPHRFSMSLQTGTTWAFALDGSIFGTYDMSASGSSSSYPVYALAEEYASAPFPFSTVTFVVAMEVLRSGSWNPVKFAGSCGTGWGVQGALQNSNLTNNQIVISSSLPALAGGTALWNGVPPPDTASPTVSITSPSTGATISRTVPVSVSASDNVGVTNVEIYKDGTLFATLTNSPYTFSWDTTKDQDGSHTLVAKAYDAANNVGTSNTVAVSVDNTQLNVTIISPLSGAKVRGSVTISVSASAPSGIRRVEFYIDGMLKGTDYRTPYTYRWNTKTVKAGTHTILVIAYDKAGNMKQTSITVSTGK